MTIHYPLSYSLTAFAISISIIIYGIVLHRKKNMKKKQKGFWIIVFGIIGGLVVITSLLTASIEFTKKGITHHPGILGVGRTYGFDYDKVKKIEVLFEKGYKGRAEQIWNIIYHSGVKEKLNPSDIWETNTKLIKEKCLENSVEFMQFQ